MKAATGLEKKNVDTVFRAISQLQDVNPDKVYRMAIRRPYTGQAGGNLRNLTGEEVFGGQPLGTLKKAFRNTDGKSKTFKNNKDLIESLENQGISVYNKEKALKNEDIVLVQGSKKTDAFELGGVNYVTAVKKDGSIVTFVNDVNDIAGIPSNRITKKMEIHAPMADRMISVSTPIHYDLLNRSNRSDVVQNALDELADNSRKIQDEARTTDLPVLPKSGLNKPQSDFVRTLADLQPSRQGMLSGSLKVGGNVAATGLRGYKPFEREARNSSPQLEP